MAPVTCVPHWVIILEQCELFLYKSKALLKVDFQVKHTILYRLNVGGKLRCFKKGKIYTLRFSSNAYNIIYRINSRSNLRYFNKKHSQFKIFKEDFEKSGF